ncbi:hypothetical protein ACSBR1_004100 [Camellia fascicularis]
MNLSDTQRDLNVKHYKILRKLPRSIFMTKCLKTLTISGCSNLEKILIDMGNMESLTVLNADGNDISITLYPEEVKVSHLVVRPWLLKPRKSPKFHGLASTPRSLLSFKS